MARLMLATLSKRGIALRARAAVLALALSAGPGLAPAAELPLEDLFSKVNPSVVLVRTRERAVIGGDQIGIVPFTDQGSGVLISADGDVLTAAHLVQVADEVEVEFADGTTVAATVVASEPAADLAMVRLARVPAGAVVASLGDSDAVRVGQQVFVIGAPYGLSHTLTVGRISARHLPGTLGGPLNLAEFFQADVSINRGNSGGPMFDMDGNVIGIVSHILSQSGGFEGVGFSVSSNSTKELLIERRSPWSGVSVFALDRRFAEIFNLPQASGLLVQRVARGSPGAALGLLAGHTPAQIGGQQLMLGGDIILEVDGFPVGTFESYIALRKHFADMDAGQTVTVKILRGGRVVELTTVYEG